MLVLSAAAAGLAARTTGPDLSGLGLPATGPVTQHALAACQAVSTCIAVATVGLLAFAALMQQPGPDRRLGPDAARAVRRASWTSAGWACVALLLVPLTVADALGRPVTRVVDRSVLGTAVPSLPAAAGALCTAVIAGAVTIGCRCARRWGTTWLLLLGAALALLPAAVTGHSGTGRQHELATDTMALHVLAVSVWVGCLFAVLLHTVENPAGAAPVVRRFSGLALVCWLAIGATGLLNAAIRSSLRDLLTTHYGALLLVKVGALGTLGCIGAVQRTRSLAALEAGRRSGLLRLGAVELVIMAATIGVSATLSRTAPPRPPAQTVTPFAGLSSLLTDWNPDLLFGGMSVLAVVFYGRSVARLRRRSAQWSRASTRCWTSGCAAVLVVTCSGVGTHAASVPGLHLIQHIVLSAVAPLLLMAGQPVRLTLLAHPSNDRPQAGQPVGPGRAVRYCLTSPTMRSLTHPLIVFTALALPTLVLHGSGFFDRIGAAHWQHLAVSAYFLLAGTLFFWPVLGRDPAPRPAAPPALRGWLMAGIVAVHLAGSVRPRNGSLIPLSAASGHLVHAAVLSALLGGFWMFLRRTPAREHTPESAEERDPHRFPRHRPERDRAGEVEFLSMNRFATTDTSGRTDQTTDTALTDLTDRPAAQRWL